MQGEPSTKLTEGLFRDFVTIPPSAIADTSLCTREALSLPYGEGFLQLSYNIKERIMSYSDKTNIFGQDVDMNGHLRPSALLA